MEFVYSKAKETLVHGAAPKETGFEHEKSLDLWDTIMEESPYAARIIAVRKLAENLKKSAAVLDLGCGGGIGLETILKNTNKEIELSGAEVSKEYLERAKSRIKGILEETDNEVVRGNIGRLQYLQFDPEKWLPKEKKYDAVFSSIVINHITSEGREELFRNVRDILKDGGVFVIYQLIHQSRFKKNPICWIMHTVPSHKEYPFREEYVAKLKRVFSSVEELLDGAIVIAKK